MARENKTSVPAAIGNQEILAEINLISQIQQIETRLALDPDSLRFAQLADAYLGIGDFDHAINLCEKGLQIHPQYDTGTLVLAKSYYLNGNKKKARDVLQNFLTSNPASLAGHKLLGDLSLAEDDVVGTVNHYRIALRFDPINRQIIQTLVDLKDKYQKIKESKSGDEEEEADAKPVVQKAPMKPATAEKPAEVKPIPPKEETKLDSFIEAAIQPDEDKFVFKEPEPKQEKIEPVAAKTETIQPPPKVAGEFAPAYTDENGIMYFYDDDEVSFDQYKKRQELQKAGKALILERALLDQKLIEKGVKTTAKVTPKEEDVFKQTEAAFEPVMSYKEAGFESEFTAVEEKPSEEKKLTSFEEHVDESMAKEEEELLSEAEQEAVLSEIEISYKDYLDILTNESDLLEAIFQEEPKEAEESEDKVSSILKSALKEEIPAEIADESDQPMAYLDYVQSLEEESEIAEASFAEPVKSDEGEPLSFTEYSAFLDHSDDRIDFNAYSMMLQAEGISPESLWKKEKIAEEEPLLKYADYLLSASESEKSEAVFETKKAEIVEETPVLKAAPAPVVEELITEIKTEEPPIPKVEPFEQKPELKAVEQQQAQPQEEAVIEEEEATEEFVEEEINPQEATPELVEKLAARGQFGTAYKVCKMLKVKNPTDAKVDRKILELKRLYVWSSQMVG
jgi:tetratricopeptide (TPR) repeat protein